MQTLETLTELDRKLEECRLAARESDDALRAAFWAFEGRFALDHPDDPFSEAYRRFQMDLYRRFAGREYDTANEATPFDLEASVSRPFPFMTGSPATAGQHLGAVAFLLRCLRLTPGARVLEFGAGWGNTTLALAQLGMRVTAVDVDARFCALLEARARRAEAAIEVVHGDFFHAETVTEPFDAVIFFECFHHCADHLRLLRALHRAVRPGGHVYFGAEPILADYPVPWGLRMDGEALWAIRQHGWLELGFRESYFRAALAHTGWLGRAMRSADLPWISVWEASAAVDRLVVEAGDARLGTLTGRKVDGRIEVAAASDGYAVYGPYVPLLAGRYAVSVEFSRGPTGAFVLDACSLRGTVVAGSAAVDAQAASRAGAACLVIDLDSAVDDLEVRLFSHRGASASVTRVVIERRTLPDPA